MLEAGDMLLNLRASVDDLHEHRARFSIQGRLHDLGLVIASSYRKLNDPCVGKQQRQMLFKWYRYLNAIHYLAYFKLDPRIGTSPDQVVQDM